METNRRLLTSRRHPRRPSLPPPPPAAATPPPDPELGAETPAASAPQRRPRADAPAPPNGRPSYQAPEDGAGAERSRGSLTAEPAEAASDFPSVRPNHRSMSFWRPRATRYGIQPSKAADSAFEVPDRRTRAPRRAPCGARSHRAVPRLRLLKRLFVTPTRRRSSRPARRASSARGRGSSAPERREG